MAHAGLCHVLGSCLSVSLQPAPPPGQELRACSFGSGLLPLGPVGSSRESSRGCGASAPTAAPAAHKGNITSSKQKQEGDEKSGRVEVGPRGSRISRHLCQSQPQMGMAAASGPVPRTPRCHPTTSLVRERPMAPSLPVVSWETVAWVAGGCSRHYAATLHDG